MLFWKTKKSPHDEELLATGKILTALAEMDKQLATVPSIADRATSAVLMIDLLEKNFAVVRVEIPERAAEEKQNPLIDPKYDHDVDALADQELKEVDRFEQHILAVIRPLLYESVSAEDLKYITAELRSELSAIERREAVYEKKIAELERLTLAERLRRSSDPVPALSTSDGISYDGIVQVVRELGGWYAGGGGKHPGSIWFPQSARPIPISADLNSGRLAAQMRAQMTHLTTAKIPGSSTLKDAFKRGTLRAA